MSSKCLWHACRALSAGLLLMLLGAAMAVIGKYLRTWTNMVNNNLVFGLKDLIHLEYTLGTFYENYLKTQIK